jgi:integrase
VNRGDLERSPLDGVEPPPPVAARDRVLSDEELALAWKCSSKLGGPFSGFFKMLILTAQRREEVAGIDWSELDRTGRIWTLPGYRTKNGKPQLLPLSEPTFQVLDNIAVGPTWPRQGLVFSTTGTTPISGFSKAKLKLDTLMRENLAAGADLTPWRAHDIRRTVATGLQRLGVRFEVTEAVLNHLSGAKSGIAGVYQRHDWATEKREALEAWGSHVRCLVESEPSD